MPTATLKIRLNTRARRLTAVFVAIIVAGVYIALATRQFLASLLGNRTELISLRRAIQRDPGNAAYYDRLGLFYERESRDPVSAVREYKAAAELNPHYSRYWLHLAGAYRVLGDTTSQTAAIERAIAVDPMTPDVAWEAANLYMTRGDEYKALQEFKIVMANDTSMEGASLEKCWRLKPDVDTLLRDAIPRTSEAYLAFLELLENKQETVGTVKVWNLLVQNHQALQTRYSYDYIRYLIQQKEVDQAVTVWKQTASLFGLSSYVPSSRNLVINGNFDLDLLNGGFDWQYQKQASVGLTLDPTESHASRRSLLITFDGPGISDAGILQLVAVQANTAYNFIAYYKSSEMEGAGGPHFTIQDMYTQKVYYESEELRDNEFWRAAEGKFTTGPDCKLVMLHIRRLPLGSPIRGRLWVSDFHISAKPS